MDMFLLTLNAAGPTFATFNQTFKACVNVKQTFVCLEVFRRHRCRADFFKIETSE